MPIPPQTVWHQRQSIDYIMSVNRAILDVASKHREDFLYRIYKMGKNSIERGQPRQLDDPARLDRRGEGRRPRRTPAPAAAAAAGAAAAGAAARIPSTTRAC